MRRIDTSQAFTIAASVVVSMYLSLACVAFFCVTIHASHQGHQATHSSACTWACQANNSVSLISIITPILPILFVFVFFTPFLTPQPAPRGFCHTSRGPPRF